MEQNIIAVIWDFDKTLVDGYMQEPIFENYGIDESVFWREVDFLRTEYKKRGIRINADTIYLNHFITCVKQGVFAGLNNKMLGDLGKNLTYYPGVPEIFDDLRNIVESQEKYRAFDIKVEHYVVSTGLAEMIRGSLINEHVDGIWGCEFIEEPILSKIKGATAPQSAPKEITQIGFAIDNTSKTRALFEINKGSNKFDVDVNAKVFKENRRVPFENMLYIADGPSDIPAFSVITLNNGKAYAIYPKGNKQGMKQVNQLLEENRINMFGEADYTKGTTTQMWLTEQVGVIAERIYQNKKKRIEDAAADVPKHLD